MTTYKVTDPLSGRTLQLTGDSPPTEQELEDIFRKMRELSGAVQEAGLTEGAPVVQPTVAPTPGTPPESQKTPLQLETEQQILRDNMPVSRERTRQILAEAGLNEGPEDKMPDVLLDIPTIKVDEIKLEVDDLDARVALSAQLANLVRLDVGAHASIAKVELDIKGVEAQALLKVRLKEVHEILARALQTLDNNPEILRSVLTPIGEAIGEIGKGTGMAVGELGTQTARSLGPGGPLSETVRKAAGDVGEVAKGVTAEKGVVSEAVRGVSQGVNRAVQTGYDEKEQERRKFHREDKEPDEPVPPNYKRWPPRKRRMHPSRAPEHAQHS